MTTPKTKVLRWRCSLVGQPTAWLSGPPSVIGHTPDEAVAYARRMFANQPNAATRDLHVIGIHGNGKRSTYIDHGQRATEAA